MKAVDNKMVKKLLRDLKKLNKHIDFEFVKYKGSYVFVDNINMNKLNLPQNWSYDGRLGLVYTDTSKQSAEMTGEDNRYYMPTINVELGKVDDIEDLAREMQRLNPTSIIEVDYSTNQPKIVSSTGIENLNCPDGFYYNDKNGLTNKHNTKGEYLSVEVERVDYINDNYALLCELQTLNPNANITINPLSMFSSPEIHTSVPVENLVLPEGFSYDDKNGITNKHTSLSGSYLSVGVEHEPIKDAYDMAREILNLNKDLEINLSVNNGQPTISIPENMAGVQLPKGFVYQNGQITNRYNSPNNAVDVACEPPKKSVLERAKDKVAETVASVKGKVAQKQALKQLNPMEFGDIKEYFDNYTVGIKDGKLIAIDRKTNKVIEDEEIVSRAQFASAWVDACGNNLSLTGNQVLDGVDERQYEYAFNEGAEQTFNSIIENVRYNLGNKINLDDMAEAVHNETGYKYAESIVEGLLKNNANSAQLPMIKAELSKSAQALNMQQSLINTNK